MRRTFFDVSTYLPDWVLAQKAGKLLNPLSPKAGEKEILVLVDRGLLCSKRKSNGATLVAFRKFIQTYGWPPRSEAEERAKECERSLRQQAVTRRPLTCRKRPVGYMYLPPDSSDTLQTIQAVAMRELANYVRGFPQKRALLDTEPSAPALQELLDRLCKARERVTLYVPFLGALPPPYRQARYAELLHAIRMSNSRMYLSWELVYPPRRPIEDHLS